MVRLDQKGVSYTDEGTSEERCSICVHYNTIGRKEDRCEIVSAYPKPILPGGWCKKYKSARPEQ